MSTGDEAFVSLLDGSFSVETLNDHESTIYGLWPNLQIAFLNDAWFQFAQENSGVPTIERWQIGSSITSAFGPLESFFSESFADCLESGNIWTHEYECSSPTHFRRFQMRTYPLGAREGLLVVNSLRDIHAQPVPRDSSTFSTDQYCNAHGLVIMCSHCRRVQQSNSATEWIWVPGFVETMPENTSHGLCPICFEYHYDV